MKEKLKKRRNIGCCYNFYSSHNIWNKLDCYMWNNKTDYHMFWLEF